MWKNCLQNYYLLSVLLKPIDVISLFSVFFLTHPHSIPTITHASKSVAVTWRVDSRPTGKQRLTRFKRTIPQWRDSPVPAAHRQVKCKSVHTIILKIVSVSEWTVTSFIPSIPSWEHTVGITNHLRTTRMQHKTTFVKLFDFKLPSKYWCPAQINTKHWIVYNNITKM